MRVVLSTIGRFHSFDLARQIHRRGALQAIFTGYPYFKLRDERLPKQSVRTYPWLHAPYMRLGGKIGRLRTAWEWYDRDCFDRHVAARMPACDLFCALSGSGLRSGRVAKSRGARYVCDRGSTHIRYQDQVLRAEYELHGLRFSGIDERIIEREESEYALADVITIPSSFALRSFLACGVRRDKLRLLPYGVDLKCFHPIGRPDPAEFHVLFAGTVCVRKGIRYLVQAFDALKHPKKRLTIIGPVDSDVNGLIASLRMRSNVTLAGRLPQVRLKQYMSRSDVLVLPSIEEGLALVQAQAMACGCPVVSTPNTGAEDLFISGVEGFIVRERDPEAITCCLQKLADDPEMRAAMREAALHRVQSMRGWDEYGDATYRLYSEMLAK